MRFSARNRKNRVNIGLSARAPHSSRYDPASKTLSQFSDSHFCNM